MQLLVICSTLAYRLLPLVALRRWLARWSHYFLVPHVPFPGPLAMEKPSTTPPQHTIITERKIPVVVSPSLFSILIASNRVIQSASQMSHMPIKYARHRILCRPTLIILHCYAHPNTQLVDKTSIIDYKEGHVQCRIYGFLVGHTPSIL